MKALYLHCPLVSTTNNDPTDITLLSERFVCSSSVLPETTRKPSTLPLPAKEYVMLVQFPSNISLDGNAQANPEGSSAFVLTTVPDIGMHET